MTSSLTTVETSLVSSVKAIETGVSELGGEVAAFWKALKAASAAKWGDVPLDAIALDDLIILAAQLCTDVSVPGAGTVLAIAKLVGGAIPESAALIRFFISVGVTPQVQNGGIAGAFMDSINGVVRPVDNPGGAVGPDNPL